jgi:hypothetical protein
VLAGCVLIAASAFSPWMIREVRPLLPGGPPQSTSAFGPGSVSDAGTIVCLALAALLPPLPLALGGFSVLLRGRSIVPHSLICVAAFTGLVLTLYVAGFFYVLAYGSLFSMARGPAISTKTVSPGAGFWLALAGYAVALLGGAILYNTTPHER